MTSKRKVTENIVNRKRLAKYTFNNNKEFYNQIKAKTNCVKDMLQCGTTEHKF